jgi:antitoxin component YwqK of YwqJK toxin-antitoxin module
MITYYILPDILQYILNLYLDGEELPNLSKILSFNFDIKSHLYIEETNNLTYDSKIIKTYIDGKLSKRNIYHENKIRHLQENYKNEKLHGTQFYYNPNGTLKIKYNYIQEKLDGRQYYYDQNGYPDHIVMYKNGNIVEK